MLVDWQVLVGRATSGDVEAYQHQDAEQRASAELAGADLSSKAIGVWICEATDREKKGARLARCML